MASYYRIKISRLIHHRFFYLVLIFIFTILSLLLNVIPDTTIILRVTSIVIVAFLALIINSINLRRSNLKVDIEDLLNLMLASIFGPNQDHYRANVMIYKNKKNMLEVKFRSYKMKGKLDENLEIDINKYPDLCVSHMVKDEAPYWTNTYNVKGHKELIKKRKVWISMKSVLSMPIFDKNQILVGALNVDSDLSLSKSLLDEENYYNLIKQYSTVLGENWIYW